MGAAAVLGAAVRRGLAATCAVAGLLVAAAVRAELHVLIVGGLGGDPVYDEAFADAASRLAGAAERTLGDDSRVTVLSGDSATREALREAFAALAEAATPADRLAVFLIGHGSDDGIEYKFNLPGPDITGTELAERLDAVPAGSQLVVNSSSASGAVLEPWTADGRIVVTATRSGRERNATRFAEHFAAALSSDEADLDKDGSISAQEAFDYTARLVAESFEAEGALATEHPEIRGDAAAAFEVARLESRVAVTPEVEALYAELDALNDQAAALRAERESLGDEYQARMVELQVEIALVQQQIDEAAAGE